MFQRRYILFCLVCITLLLSSCTFFKNLSSRALAVTQCSIELENVTHKISFKEKTSNIFNYVISVNLIGKNPTDVDVSLGRYKLDLYANDKYITSFTTDTPIKLSANSNTRIPVKLIVAPGTTAGLIFKKLIGKPIEYKVNGTFYLSLGAYTISIERQLFHIER